MNSNQSLVAALMRSKVYQEYERAFADATGLTVVFRVVDSGQPLPNGKRVWNPACPGTAHEAGDCEVCVPLPRQRSENNPLEPVCIVCPIGLCNTAVPVQMGGQLIGFLQTGKVPWRKPHRTPMRRTDPAAGESEIRTESKDVHEAYSQGRILDDRERQAIVKLLTLFSQHLSVIGNQILVQQASPEPPVIARARDYIARHYTEDLSLPLVARAVNTSTHYFCKLFKKHTGINFIDHVSRVRIERAKTLLQNPNLRVSEIAYEVGFQSLTHFNRVFKRIEGLAPTVYRRRLTKYDPSDTPAS